MYRHSRLSCSEASPGVDHPQRTMRRPASPVSRRMPADRCAPCGLLASRAGDAPSRSFERNIPLPEVVQPLSRAHRTQHTSQRWPPARSLNAPCITSSPRGGLKQPGDEGLWGAPASLSGTSCAVGPSRNAWRAEHAVAATTLEPGQGDTPWRRSSSGEEPIDQARVRRGDNAGLLANASNPGSTRAAYRRPT